MRLQIEKINPEVIDRIFGGSYICYYCGQKLILSKWQFQCLQEYYMNLYGNAFFIQHPDGTKEVISPLLVRVKLFGDDKGVFTYFNDGKQTEVQLYETTAK